LAKKDHSNIALTFVVITGVALSFFSGFFLYKMEEKAIINEFHKDVDERAASLYRETIINFETLRSLAILFDSVNAPEWQRFRQEAAKILTRHSDIQALEWIPHVTHAERIGYESKQLQGLPYFQIIERKTQGDMVRAENRDEYFPVYFIEPLVGNESAFGFDLASNPTRAIAIDMARDSGIPHATASITLVQEYGKQKGFLAFLPIYKQGNLSTTKKRRKYLLGFILGVFRVGNIFSSSNLHFERQGIEFSLLDTTTSNKKDILHVESVGSDVEIYRDITYEKNLPELWERQWTLVGHPSTHYFSDRRNMLPIAVFVSFITFTVYISLYINFILRRASQIQKKVAGKTIALNEANRKLELLSRSDGLTGIANRRYLDEFIDREWRRAIRNNTSISLILIDIDFFKAYNDHYGHPKGDDCLKTVAKTLKTLIQRPDDLVARYGGEEFALVLPNTENATLVSQNCLRSIEKLQLPHDYSENANVVTISIGYCTVFPTRGSNQRTMLEGADQALYRAKDSGRNTMKYNEIQ